MHMTTTADRLLAKLKEFAATLDEPEREVLEVLLAPAVALATEEVAGFAMPPGIPAALPPELVEGIKSAGLSIDR